MQTQESKEKKKIIAFKSGVYFLILSILDHAQRNLAEFKERELPISSELSVTAMKRSLLTGFLSIH